MIDITCTINLENEQMLMDSIRKTERIIENIGWNVDDGYTKTTIICTDKRIGTLYIGCLDKKWHYNLDPNIENQLMNRPIGEWLWELIPDPNYRIHNMKFRVIIYDTLKITERYIQVDLKNCTTKYLW